MEFQFADLEDLTQDLIERIRKIGTELERIKKYWNWYNPEVKKLVDGLKGEMNRANSVFSQHQLLMIKKQKKQ